MFKEASYVT